MLFKVIKALWERHKRTEKLRKELHMTKRCSKELDILLGLIGIDYSQLELCSIPEEIINEVQTEEKGRH